VTGTTIDIKTDDGVADAYLTRPESGEPRAGVLFLMDAFGLRPVIEEMADRIAAQGYVVLAPNLFYREGRAPRLEMPDPTDPDRRAAFFEKLRPMMDALVPERIVADGRAYLDRLAQETAGPVALSGYCMGARVGWRIASAYPDRVAALGGFHAGGLVTDDPDSPHRSVDQLDAQLYFGHADNDPSNSAEQIKALEDALDRAGITYRSEVYEGAAHGYTMADTAAFNEPARERHFTALFGLLKRAL
jgi:carboxymethylenebutenolidase